MTRFIVLVCALAIAAFVGGCSQANDGSGSPPSGASIQSQSRQLSPPVENPRDIRDYGDRPCDVFTLGQLTSFGFDRPPDGIDELPSGHKECVWTDSGYKGRLVAIVYPDWDILERTYL